jgi:hypothetical protein
MWLGKKEEKYMPYVTSAAHASTQRQAQGRGVQRRKALVEDDHVGALQQASGNGQERRCGIWFRCICRAFRRKSDYADSALSNH